MFFIEKISFSLKLFSDHFYGQSFIKTVRGPFHSLFFQRFFLYTSSISNYQCSMHFYEVHPVFVEKAEISCHRAYFKILNMRLSPSTMPLNMFFYSQRINKNARKCFVLQRVVLKRFVFRVNITQRHFWIGFLIDWT